MAETENTDVSASDKKLVGAILLLVALLSTAFVLWFSYRVVAFNVQLGLIVFSFGSIGVLIAWFSWALGLRLVLNRPNRYGSVMSPLGWYAVAIACLGLGIGVAAATLSEGEYIGLGGAAGMAFLAVCGVVAGRRLAVRAANAP